MPVKLPLIPKPASTTPQAYPGPQPGPHPHPWPFYPPQPQPVVYPWPVINPATGGYWGYTPYVGPVATVTLGSACCTERVRFQRGPVRRFFGRLFGR
jgi:hypothetical protein